MVERWYVKKNGDTRRYALTNALADAELLAQRLSTATGEPFYAAPVPAPTGGGK